MYAASMLVTQLSATQWHTTHYPLYVKQKLPYAIRFSNFDVLHCFGLCKYSHIVVYAKEYVFTSL